MTHELQGKQVRVYVETPDQVFVIEGRLDAYGAFDRDRVMLAIGQPDTPEGGQIHMLPNDPETKVTFEELPSGT